LLRRVEVPPALEWGALYPNAGVMPRGPEKVAGMEKPKRARKRKPETSQGGPGAGNLQFSGGQGVHREVESEGHEEKYRAVIDGGYPEDEPVGQRWGKVEPAL
jgi:hypothetical protein